MRIRILSVIILAACLSAGCGVSGNSTKPNDTKFGTKLGENTKRAELPTLPVPRLDVDTSGSLMPEETQSTVIEFVRQATLKAKNIGGIKVLRFADAATSNSATAKDFIWSTPPPDEFVPDESRLSKQAQMLTLKKKQQIEVQRQEFESRKVEMETTYSKTVDEQLQRLTNFVLEKPAKDARCTDFNDYAKRIEREGAERRLVITDGYYDCLTRKVTQNVTSEKLIFILVRSKGEGANTESIFEERKGLLKQIFPNAEVYPAYMAKEAIQELFDQP